MATSSFHASSGGAAHVSADRPYAVQRVLTWAQALYDPADRELDLVELVARLEGLRGGLSVQGPPLVVRYCGRRYELRRTE